MFRISKNISGWFGYSRGERRASIILLFLIALVMIFPYLVPAVKTGFKEVSPVMLEREQPILRPKCGTNTSATHFKFDPNTVSPEELHLLGLNARQIRTLLNYRQKGGRFRKPQDITRIYGIDSAFSSRLLHYVTIGEEMRLHNKRFIPDSLRFRNHLKSEKIRIEINNCDSADLERLPGIGPVLSSRIIRYRDRLGGFYSLSQLMEVYGITDSTFNLISGKLRADSAAILTIDLNSANFDKLIRHPYLERYDVQSLLKYRSLMGNIDSLPELVLNNILSRSKAEKLKPYLRFK